MHCAEFEHRLNAVLDDRRQPENDARLSAHAAGCPQCRELLDEHVALLSGLDCITTPALNRGFSRRVVEAARPSLPAGVQGVLRPSWLRAGPILVAAAVMLLAVSVVWYARAARAPGAGPLEWVFESGGNTGTLAIAAGSPRPSKSSDIQGNASWLLELPRLPSRWQAYRNALGEISVASWHLEEMEQLAPGIRPLRASVSVIWDTIRRTIPSSQHDSSPPPDGTPRASWNFDRQRVA